MKSTGHDCFSITLSAPVAPPVSHSNLVLTGSLAQLPYDEADKLLQGLVRVLTNSQAFQLWPQETIMMELTSRVRTLINAALLLKEDEQMTWPDWVSALDRGRANQKLSQIRKAGRDDVQIAL